MTGFLLAGFDLSNMVALIFGAAARRFREESEQRSRPPPASDIWDSWFGRLVVGSLSGALGLRTALALVVVTGLVISFAASNVMAEIA
jgi:hypothetical protein